MSDQQPLEWLATTTWSRDRLAVRGVAEPTLQSLQVVLIGVGAVGARLAELLVRLGVRRLHLIDGDSIEAGNLVRHIATLHALHISKATAICAFLKAAAPHAETTADPHTLSESPSDAAAQLGEADLVIDATASDEVLRTLSQLPDGPTRRWFSVSLNRHAERIYCYLAHGQRFPLAAFHQAFEPWRSDDARRHPEELPWEGPGCWSPVFPARVDDITALVALAIRELEHLAVHPPAEPALRVYQRQCDSDGRLIEICYRAHPRSGDLPSSGEPV